MKLETHSIAVAFLMMSIVSARAQQTKTDSLKREKIIDNVVLQGTSNKKSEAALLTDQKRSLILKQSVGRDEISRKGISNLEQGLTKITGVNTVESRGLFVRGLEERYNNLLLNGLATPSNNPFQKIIELKQFPTAIISKFDIYKTYNASLYGDFAGATLDMSEWSMQAKNRGRNL